MPSFTTESVIRTEHRWIVPVGPLGAAGDDVEDALTAARLAWRELTGTRRDAPVPGDVVRVHVRDDAVVLSFEAQDQRPV
ncbi:hypothetical protein G3I40_12290 [Streptomyces sp. SID14478]|uniref:hypothetical protein n=1 Tax=Streptomyces sp. SID14478 TaxID=2706073 RepID=UPI0013DCBF1D|nr:hypothetical protein [Streptomyces sp. SID14478]NEB75994.1 hypothetical protein [Streptomyces sp. SID14478]